MVTINIQEANKKLKDAFANLSEEQTKKAISRAINRTLDRGRNQHLKKAILSKYIVTSADVKPGLKVFRANKNSLEGRIDASSKSISLTHFRPKFEFPEGGSTGVLSIIRKRNEVKKIKTSKKGAAQKGVSIQITKGNRESIPFAFMVRGNQKVVFARGEYSLGGYGFVQRHTRVNKKGNDNPITKMITASISGMANNKDVQSLTSIDLTTDYEKRLLHEIDFITKNIK